MDKDKEKPDLSDEELKLLDSVWDDIIEPPQTPDPSNAPSKPK